MAFCSNCGNELKDGAQFCPNCGQQVNQRPSTSEQPKGFVESFKETWKELESEEKKKDTKKKTTPQKKKDTKKKTTPQKKKDEDDWKYGCGLLVGIALVIGISVNECSGDDSKDETNAPQTEQVVSDKQTETKESETEVKEEQKKAEEKNSRSAFVGDYVYSYYIGNTNAKLYFKISLKSDGTFTFSPNNETTKTQMDIDKVMSGYDYPEGGIWEVKDTSVGKAVFLKFDCDWGEGSISANKSVIQINNMNGHTLKAPLTTD